ASEESGQRRHEPQQDDETEDRGEAQGEHVKQRIGPHKSEYDACPDDAPQAGVLRQRQSALGAEKRRCRGETIRGLTKCSGVVEPSLERRAARKRSILPLEQRKLPQQPLSR